MGAAVLHWELLSSTGEWMLVCHAVYVSLTVMLHLHQFYLLNGARYSHKEAFRKL